MLLVGILALSACSSKRSERRPPEEKPEIRQVADPRELLEELISRNDAIDSLRTSYAEFEYRRTNTTNPYEGTEIRFAVEKPGKVYARASATAVGDIFFLHTNGRQFWVEATREEKLYTGTVGEERNLETATDDELYRYLTPNILLEALLIDDLANYAHTSFAIEPDFYIILMFDAGDDGSLILRRQVWIEREGLTVERHKVFNSFGELATEAFLYQYKKVDGHLLPHYLRIERNWESISIKFTLNEIVLNSDLPDELFEYGEPPAGFEVIALDKREKDAKPGKS